ncbi:hypothetical protein ACFQV4_34240 [Streptomyces thermocarboxydus]
MNTISWNGSGISASSRAAADSRWAVDAGPVAARTGTSAEATDRLSAMPDR